MPKTQRLKALYYSGALDGWVLADDSGLQVDALDLAPGVYSSRFAGYEGSDPKERDHANNRKLLDMLAETPRHKRTARFRCCLCLAKAGQVKLEVSGKVEGQIAFEPHGENGFGYDPLFYLPEQNKTIAQLPPSQKNALSHRGRALQQLLSRLAPFLPTH